MAQRPGLVSQPKGKRQEMVAVPVVSKPVWARLPTKVSGVQRTLIASLALILCARDCDVRFGTALYRVCLATLVATRKQPELLRKQDNTPLLFLVNQFGGLVVARSISRQATWGGFRSISNQAIAIRLHPRDENNAMSRFVQLERAVWIAGCERDAGVSILIVSSGRFARIRAGFLAAGAIALVMWLLRFDLSEHHASKSTRASEVQMSRRVDVASVISGRVTSETTGNGIPGAVVSISQTHSTPFVMDIETVVASDSNGYYFTEVPSGEYRISASATGFLVGVRDQIEVKAGERRNDIDLALEVGGRLVNGVVTSFDGKPLSGVQIIARCTHGLGPVALTNAQGEFQIGLVDDCQGLEARHDNYANEWKSLDSVDRASLVRLILRPGGSIAGKVVTKGTNEAIANAMIESRGVLLAESDEQGRFRIDRLPAEEVWISVRARGYATSKSVRVGVEVGQQVDLELTCVPAFTINGRVVNSFDVTKGIGGVRVGAKYGVQQIHAGSTDVDGTFEIAGALPGEYSLFASKDGFLSEFDVRVEVFNSDISAVISLSHGVTLTGRIEPPSIANIGLVLELDLSVLDNPSAEFNARQARAESDSNGLFTLSGVPNGKFKLTAVAGNGSAGSLPVAVEGKDLKDLLVKVSPRASVRGKVVDTNRAPVVGEIVYASKTPPDGGHVLLSITEGDFSQARTHHDGSFDIRGLTPGRFLVYVDNGPKAEIDLSRAVEFAGVTLVVIAHDGVIRGQVFSDDGLPVADGTVVASREVRGEVRPFASGQRVRIDAAGGFVIAGVESGSYSVFASGPGGNSHGVQAGVKTGEKTRISLVRPGRIVVSLTLHGQLTGSFNVMCVGLSVPGGCEDRNVGPIHIFDHIPAGQYACTMYFEGHTLVERITVPPGGDAKFAIDIESK